MEDQIDLCPVDICAQIIAGKWTLQIIRDLSHGPLHFRELEMKLGGISPRTMCERLRTLARHGIVTRTYYKGLPPRTVYELTEAGTKLIPIIDEMRRFGSEWIANPPRIDVTVAEHSAAWTI